MHGECLAKDGIDLKTDIGAFGKKLAELAAKNKEKQLALQLELSRELLYSHVLDLMKAAESAGIKGVSPVPLDP